ncbi:MAG: DUF4105 domain-containing protein [Marinomonas atlantica]|nr:DUF4105 domain-containing protein [Marinomonas atlantica]
MYKIILCILVGLLSTQVYSTASTSLETIASTQQWRVLGHYQPYFGAFKSSITSANFFLAKQGSNDPKAELIATIEAFQSDQLKVYCQYPARYLFLLQYKLVNPRDVKSACIEYRNYLAELPVKSISLVYASGFLGNPASMFGHLLLRLNLGQSSQLLDNTFNFGAIVPSKDNKFVYIFKGITGGYVSRFSDEPFYHHSNIYNEDELRNMWEYELDLDETQISLLLAHRFELRNVTFDYYFFTENCAYQLAFLLGLVNDEPVLQRKYPWVLPIDVITALADFEPSIITSFKRRPSRQQLFYDRYQQLTAITQNLIENYLSENRSLSQILDSVSQKSEKKQLIEVLLDYFSYLEIRQDSLTKIQLKQRQELLVARFSMGIGAAEWTTREVLPPHKTQRPMLIQLSHVWQQNGSETQLKVRGSYYDALSINEPENNFSALETMNFVLSDSESKGLKRIDLINVRNIKPDNTQLDGDQSHAWTAKFGFQPATTACSNCSVGYVEGGFGKAFGGFNRTVYGLLTTRLQTHHHNIDTGYLGAEIGAVIKPVNWWRSRLVITSELGLNSSLSSDSIKWQQAFSSSPHWDVRVTLEKSQDTSFTVGAGYYW